jgi:hypothetical protein
MRAIVKEAFTVPLLRETSKTLEEMSFPLHLRDAIVALAQFYGRKRALPSNDPEHKEHETTTHGKEAAIWNPNMEIVWSIFLQQWPFPPSFARMLHILSLP